MEEKPVVPTEVNRLYWETETSVAEIANQLSVSRRALYELIEPMSTGMKCSDCGAELYFSNRSAKAAGVARCLMCGNEKDLTAEAAPEAVGSMPPYTAGLPKVRHAVPVSTAQRTAAIAGFAIAGVVAGSIVTLLIRRKR